MAQPKAQTLQERFGFQDDDLKLTTHDDIMYWVHANIDTIVTELFGEWAQKQWDASGRDGIMPALKVTGIDWEYPISTKTGFTVGFADMLVWAPLWGYVTSPRVRHMFQVLYVYFEIKTKLPTAGELLRQIRLYQSHTEPEYAWVVVCPDDRHAAILKDQGIYFYKSPVGS